MRRCPLFLFGLFLGVVVAMILNLPTWFRIHDGILNIADLGAEEGSVDEMYYFAALREGMDGHWGMGNASLANHAQEISLMNVALVPQAFFVAIGVPLIAVIVAGDVIFPLILTMLFFFLALAIGMERRNAALFSIVSMLYWGVVWLRVSNPQVTMAVFLWALLLFLRDRPCRAPWKRALGLSMCMLVQPIHALLIIAVEFLDACRSLFSRSLLAMMRTRWPIILLALMVAMGMLAVMLTGDAMTVTDTAFRRGLIHSHIPANPVLQLIVFSAIIAWAYPCYQRRVPLAEAGTYFVLLGACLLVLNQSLLHGRDAVFTLYYRMPVGVIVSLSFLRLAYVLALRRTITVVLVLIAIVSGTSVVRSLLFFPTIERGRSLEQSEILTVLESLDRLPPGRVILAPLELSDLVPVLTRHSSLFTQYARYEMVSDQELVQRYLAQESIFAFPPSKHLEGNPMVFGIGAGNSYARHKIFCALHRWAGRKPITCRQFELSDFIAHQDLRLRLEERTYFDPLPVLARFGVTTIVTSEALPGSLLSWCRRIDRIGRYDIYDCRFTINQGAVQASSKVL